MPRWPGDPAVAFRPVADLGTDGYRLRELTIGEHSGTHVNAPSTLFADGVSVDAVDPDRLVAPLVVIDARARCEVDADHALTGAEVAAWEAEHGRVPPRALVVMFTGWQDRWDDPAAYLGADAAGVLHFPGIAPETARWLFDERAVGGFGIDTHGVDPGRDDSLATNRIALAAGCLVVENLAHLDEVPPAGATAVIGVLALTGGTGSPARVLALAP
jgi:kynurenine formamidase